MTFNSLNIISYKGINKLTILLTFLTVISCDNDDSKMDDENGIVIDPVVKVELPKRSGPLPNTTTSVPHVQIGVEPVPEVNEELFRRVYSYLELRIGSLLFQIGGVCG